MFLRWLHGKASQAELTRSTGRTFRHTTAWCWELEPHLPRTGEVHDVVLVDGVWVGSWCLLIAQSATGTVIAWQWCARESTPAWTALFEQFPAPRVVITDGGSGIRSALASTWPHTHIQRCIFHIQLNITRELTRKPRTAAGRALRAIALALTDVRTPDDAIHWQLLLQRWWDTFGHLTKERTLFRNGKWGYAHDRLRKAWGVLYRVARSGHAFTHLGDTAPRTTSRLEGLNSQLRHMLRHHRGMPIEHRKRAAEWFLVLHEIPIHQAHTYATMPTPSRVVPEEEPLGPELYGTGLDASEGLWERAGWGGRHQ